MSHLTYKQRRKFLSSPFFISDAGLYYQECRTFNPIGPEFNPDYAKKGEEIYCTIYVDRIRRMISQNRIYTLSYITDQLTELTTCQYNYLKARVRNTILYFEYEGYVCFLPDIDGELTFCNYMHFKELNS